MKLIVMLLLLWPSCCLAALPAWQDAKKIMASCYAGWNATVSVKAGLQSQYDINEYEDSNVFNTLGEQTDTAGGTSTKNESSVTNSESAYDSYNSSKALDAEYSRNRLNHEAAVGLFLTIPLYSREIRLERKEKENQQIEHLADLYAQNEGHQATVAALEEQKMILKTLMKDNGSESINAYLLLLAELEKSKALMSGAERKALAILENCGYVAKSRVAGKR
jgi:hypothetical protein